MIKISVILPTYNSEKTIAKTIDAVLSQEGKDILFELELLIIDDCSTDRTLEIIQNKGLKYYSTEKNSGGPNKSRNMGLKMCTGDYICFLDHDDYWAPNKIFEQLKYAFEYPIITTAYVVHDHNTGRVLERFTNEPAKVFKQNEAFLSLLARSRKSQIYCISNIMIKAELKNILFEEAFGVSDYDWIVRIFENRTSVEIPQNLMIRNVYKTNLSLTHSFCKEDFYYSLYFLEDYEDKYPKEVKEAIKRIYGTRARFYYLINKQKKARELFYKYPFFSKNILYIITSYFCAKFIIKRFHFFG